MGVNEGKDGVQRRNLWVNYHLQMLEEEGKQKEAEKEQPTSRRKTREGGLREVHKRKFFTKEAAAKYVRCHDRLSQ